MALAVATTTLGAAAMSASPAAATVTIDAPVAPRAGTVDLTGSVGVDPGEVTTVLYVFDATSSTASPTGLDCSGNGVLGPEDDLNQDQSVGDILDCEIAGVGALNRSLVASSGLQVGMVAFANQAAAADLDPVGSATFVPPGFTGGDPRPRIDTAAGSVVRDRIGLYDPKDLGGSGAGTAFNSAISETLSTLGTAPAGPKWIMFLSDGQAAIDDALLGQLAQSGVRLRSFGIGADATCAATGSLYKMAAATGESCQRATQPASLAAGLTGSRPDALNGVSVTIGGVSVAATVDAVGGWKASFALGAGAYTATVRAVLASGVTQTALRTFTVAAAPAGPAPETVTPGPGALAATVVKVARPDALARRPPAPGHWSRGSPHRRAEGGAVAVRGQGAAAGPLVVRRSVDHGRPRPGRCSRQVRPEVEPRRSGCACSGSRWSPPEGSPAAPRRCRRRRSRPARLPGEAAGR